MERKNNIIYFESDDEFLDYCLDKRPIIKEGKHCKYTDYEFTKLYYDELKNGTRFCIKDENSAIEKHGVITFRTISKKVDNLEPWFGIEL